MLIQLPAGPLTGPTAVRNRRRNPFWRFRRGLFVLAIAGVVGIGAVWSYASRVALVEDNFDDLIETTYICTADVLQGCGPGNAANELAVEGQDRVVVDYAEIPEVLVQAVVATEDQSFFDHRGIDPSGLLRAAYQVGKQQLTDGGGSFQGGSTITQQYIKLSTADDAVEVSRKAREIVRAVKLEQQLEDSLGSKQAAKEQIIDRYLNRAYFGRGVYGVQSAARAYFDKDVGQVTLAEAAYLAGLLKNPSSGDASKDLDEAIRRRSITLGQMLDQKLITIEQQLEAEADTWPNLIPPPVEVVGIGEVANSDIGTEYFIAAVRQQLNDIYPRGEFYTQSLRVYTTLDPDLQRLAYKTITAKLDPNNEFMPLGSLVSLNDDGEVVAMMGGADWERSQVNLATGRRGGGSGFQAGSLMKTFALAEFIEQGFSPESLYEAPFTIEYPQDADGKCAAWKVQGGVTNDKTRENHRTVYQATAGSINTVFAQMITQIGAPQVMDMANRLGIESDMLDCPSLVLGPNSVSPLEMAGAYANLNREGLRLDPVLIERIEDADGNVLCWYPVDSCSSTGSPVRSGEQVIEPSVARQVNGALQGVVSGGTGRAARLIDEADETTRPAAGKTGTTQNNRDAWFTGFTCGYTTAVWVGYPGIDGEPPRYMNDAQNAENGVVTPTIAELFGTDKYNNSRGNGDITGGEIPAELWHDFTIEATRNGPPCDELPTERPGPGQEVLGVELLTTLLPCAEPALTTLAPQSTTLAEQTTTTAAQSTTSLTDTTPAAPTTIPPTTTTTALPDSTAPSPTTPPPSSDAADGQTENAVSPSDAIRPVLLRSVPDQRHGLARQALAAPETTVPQTVDTPVATVPSSAPPTTEPCIPVDLDGNPITPGSTPAPSIND